MNGSEGMYSGKEIPLSFTWRSVLAISVSLTSSSRSIGIDCDESVLLSVTGVRGGGFSFELLEIGDGSWLLDECAGADAAARLGR